MLFLLSPAKTLDERTTPPTNEFTQPKLLSQSQILIDELQKLAPQDIAKLMKVSDKIAHLNMERFSSFAPPFNLHNAKQAIFLFKGDVYEGINAYHLDLPQIHYLQNHLGILSGLYGLLKPLDLIHPYRLEMGTKLQNIRGKDLYIFWHNTLTEAVNQYLNTNHSTCLVNLASNEYFKSIQPKKLSAKIITPIFKDKKNDRYKIISFYAKRARGLMTRFATLNHIQNPEDLKQFESEGYYYSKQHSNEKEWIFLRDSAH